MRVLLGLSCLLLFVFSAVHASEGGDDPDCSDPAMSAVVSLARRLLPLHEGQLCFLPNEPHPPHDDDGLNAVNTDPNTDTDSAGSWSVECEQGPVPPTRHPRIEIRGSDPVAAASGLHWYLKYHANASVSWNGNQLGNVPDDLTCPGDRLTGATTYEFRYYMNTCTFGYSTAFWTFDRWEQEIDWMALNGIQTPLAFVGQEFFWQEAFIQDYGLQAGDMNDFFSGPAFLPWYRMGNLAEWQGPLAPDWLQRRLTLQNSILSRMREFGMRPVLPGFNGFVPEAFVKKYPNATVTRSGGWNGFPATYQLSPLDPMFSIVAQSILNRMLAVWSTDHLYSVDLWNELSPTTTDLNKLADIGRAVYSSLSSVDPSAVWVMQGWMFYSDSSFWQPPRIKSFVKSVPAGKLLILDLFSDVRPVWNATESYFGTPFVWNMLHNFGGRSGLYGRLPVIASEPANALAINASTGALRGLGLTPEAIGFNPIVYDLMMENVWRGVEGVPDLDDWVRRWAERRYGIAPTYDVPAPSGLAAIHEAWNLLQHSVYSCGTLQQGTSGSVFAARPGFDLKGASCCDTLELYYDPADVETALANLLDAAADAPFLATRPTFTADLVAVTAQAASNAALSLYHGVVSAYSSHDVDTFSELSQRFLDMLTDLDTLLATQPDLLLGKWVGGARDWAPVPSPSPGAARRLRSSSVSVPVPVSDPAPPSSEWTNLYQRNARTQITLWGSKTSGLHDYAYKLWSGMAADFYSARWGAWFDEGLKALNSHQPLDNATFLASIESYEYSWTQDTDVGPEAPSGDALALTCAFYAKYLK